MQTFINVILSSYINIIALLVDEVSILIGRKTSIYFLSALAVVLAVTQLTGIHSDMLWFSVVTRIAQGCETLPLFCAPRL